MIKILIFQCIDESLLSYVTVSCVRVKTYFNLICILKDYLASINIPKTFPSAARSKRMERVICPLYPTGSLYLSPTMFPPSKQTSPKHNQYSFSEHRGKPIGCIYNLRLKKNHITFSHSKYTDIRV